MVLLKGAWIGALYKLQGSAISDGCNSSIAHDIGAEEEKTFAVSEEKVVSWNQRLRHIGEKGLRLLHSKGIVEAMSNFSLDLDLCEHCVYGKNNLVRFPFGAMRAKGILQLAHYVGSIIGKICVLYLIYR
jgi:hypothetical protein